MKKQSQVRTPPTHIAHHTYVHNTHEARYNSYRKAPVFSSTPLGKFPHDSTYNQNEKEASYRLWGIQDSEKKQKFTGSTPTCNPVQSLHTHYNGHQFPISKNKYPDVRHSTTTHSNRDNTPSLFNSLLWYPAATTDMTIIVRCTYKHIKHPNKVIAPIFFTLANLVPKSQTIHPTLNQLL